MASTPPVNQEFLREVDDELRRDQLAGFWKRWGRWLIVAIVVGLAAFGAWLWWSSQQAQAREAEGEVLSQALTDLEEQRPQGVEARLQPLANGDTPGYRATAKLTLAAMKLQAGDIPAALAGYRAVAEDTTLPQAFRDLAVVRWTAAEYDRLRPEQVIARLGPLARAGSPWFGSAGEMVAVAHLNANRPQQAGPIFAAMAKDEQVPESIRQRAVQMAGLLGVDAVADNTSVGDERE